jgi:hypothetical protein
MSIKPGFLPYLLVAFTACIQQAEDNADVRTEAAIPPQRASRYIGEVKTVCGNVSSATYLPLNRGQPTYLTLGISYSKEICKVVIWGSDRSKFSEPPDRLYRDKRIRVRGKLKKYRGHPQIKVTNPDQIEIIWPASNRPDTLRADT